MPKGSLVQREPILWCSILKLMTLPLSGSLFDTAFPYPNPLFPSKIPVKMHSVKKKHLTYKWSEAIISTVVK